MLTQYKNKDLLNKSGAEYVTRFDSTADKLLIKNIDIINYSVPSVEMHIYSTDTWITGDHAVTINHTNENLIDPLTKQKYKFNGTVISYNVENAFKKLNLTSGKFRYVVNFFKNVIGSYDKQYLYIEEISPDRLEVKLRITSDIDSTGTDQYVKHALKFTDTPQTDTIKFPIYTQYLLNFSRNKTVAYVNSVFIDETLYVKLLDPLPDDINVNFKCWVVEELKLPYTDTVALTPIKSKKTFKTLSSANFEVSVGNLNISSETDIKNWNDLLGSSIQTSQQIVDKYFAGSLEGIPLNIDFRDFNNFIFYSSAEERLHNFRYKLELLEYYNGQINTLSGILGNVATTNVTDYTALKTNLISGFDSFEKYLYHESSSILFNNDIPVINAPVSSLTGSYIFPAPKTNASKPFNLYSVTSSIFNEWYDSLIESASAYDNLNINKLTNFLPPSIQFSENNEQVNTFVNMLGHHYDILHMYIKQASLIYKHEENPKIGMPDDLLFSVAKQFGWNLADGNQYQDLWQYVLGTDEAGGLITGSNSVGDPSVAGSKMTRMVWRRIVNNLPMLLKSKGTKRSVQALLSCYGIPESMISINEYGGPNLNKIPVYEKLNFDYSLDLINNATGTVTIDYNKPVGAVELRFRLDDVVTNPLLPSTMNLITISGSQVNVKLNFTRGNLGTATIYDHLGNTSTTSEIELFDGNWLSMLINKNGSKLDLFINKAKYGKIIAAVTASITSTLPTNGSVKLGVPGTGTARLYGQLQEFRLWTGSLSLDAFANHTKAPSAYDGTVDSYDELIFRLPLTQKINHAITSSLPGVQPVSSSITASFSSWTNNEPYDSIEETYYFDGISVAMSTHEDNKIRIESSELDSKELQLLKRIERSEFDDAPLDSNKLGIYFSPQTMINDDIIAQLGYTELDSYIGDPGDFELDEYPDLEKRAHDYWKKYTNTNNINEYIRVFTLFDLSFFKQLEQILPARADKMTGLLIQPNLLERNKQSLLPTVQREYQPLSFELSGSARIIEADYTVETAVIDVSGDTLINSELNDDLQINIPFAFDTNLSGSILNSITSPMLDTGSKQPGIPLFKGTFNFEITDITGANQIGLQVYKTNVVNVELLGPKLGSNPISLRPYGFIDDNLFFYITSEANGRYDGTAYNHKYLIWSGSKSITGSSPYGISDGVFPTITGNVKNETLKKIETFMSGGIKYTISSSATVTEFLPTGYMNSKYNGSKMTSAGFNIGSPDTYQGKPVVEIITVNPWVINFNPTVDPKRIYNAKDFDSIQVSDMPLDSNWNRPIPPSFE
jgi:hypothetical protein